MEEALSEIKEVEGVAVQQMNDIKDQLVRVDGRLSLYCIEEFGEVVDKINAKISGDSKDDDEDGNGDDDEEEDSD